MIYNYGSLRRDYFMVQADFVNFFATSNTPVCGGSLHVNDITLHVVQKKHFFEIL